MNDYQRRAAEILDRTGPISRRGIARALLLPKSTVSDYLRKVDQETVIRILAKSRSVQ